MLVQAFVCPAGNSRKQCKLLCYNKGEAVSAEGVAQPFPAGANHNG